MVQQSSSIVGATEPSVDSNAASSQHNSVSIRSLAGIVWVVLSTVVESIAGMIISVFSQYAAHLISRSWSKQLLAVHGIRVSARGLQNIRNDERYVFVSNHQSHLDIPSLFSVLPHRLKFMAKKELFYIPFFGWGIYRLGHVSVDRSSARKARMSFTRAVERLKKESISLVIFPEGTRSVTGKIGEFKRGSFALPIESGLKVVPVVISGTKDCLPKKKLLIGPGSATVTFGTPIDVSEMKKQEAADVVREAIVSISEGLQQET